jgi:hypothetical protein
VPVRVTPGGTTSVSNPIRAPTSDEQQVIDTAEKERTSALASALQQLTTLLSRQPEDDGDDSSGAPSFSAADQKVVVTVLRWLYLTSVNATFWDCVKRVVTMINQNQGLGTLTPWVDTEKTDHAYVYAFQPDQGVFFTKKTYLTGDNTNCQREVIVHEYFHHIVGPAHYYATEQTDEAMKCPHHLAELVLDLATGCTGGCTRVGICR